MHKLMTDARLRYADAKLNKLIRWKSRSFNFTAFLQKYILDRFICPWNSKLHSQFRNTWQSVYSDDTYFWEKFLQKYRGCTFSSENKIRTNFETFFHDTRTSDIAAFFFVHLWLYKLSANGWRERFTIERIFSVGKYRTRARKSKKFRTYSPFYFFECLLKYTRARNVLSEEKRVKL